MSNTYFRQRETVILDHNFEVVLRLSIEYTEGDMHKLCSIANDIVHILNGDINDVINCHINNDNELVDHENKVIGYVYGGYLTKYATKEQAKHITSALAKFIAHKLKFGSK